MADAPRGGWEPAHDELAKKAGHPSWAAWCEAIEVDKGHPICGRRNNREEPCRIQAGGPSRRGKRTDHPGQGACGNHGGLSLMGPAHGAWKTGERAVTAKYRLSGRIAEVFARLEEILPDAFDLAQEARMADARMVELHEILSEGGHVSGGEIAKITGQIREAVAAGKVEAITAAFGELDELAKKAKGGDRAWKQWREFAELKRKLADTRARQQAREHGPVDWAFLALLIDRFKYLAGRYVPKDELNAFAKEIAELTPAGSMALPLHRGHDA